jgi:Na+-translocating ferredoxin:NAD+ oxidoreductase RNF subunit RnfB
LDTDLAKAIKKRKLKEEIYDLLRKIDCGVCGAPTCLTFAEDVVKGDAKLDGCIFGLSDNMEDLSEELSGLLNESIATNLNRSNIKNTNNNGD